jgi:hypothetical protein
MLESAAKARRDDLNLSPANAIRSVRSGLGDHELWKNGIKVKLGEQPFEILAVLLNRPGNWLRGKNYNRFIARNRECGERIKARRSHARPRVFVALPPPMPTPAEQEWTSKLGQPLEIIEHAVP